MAGKMVRLIAAAVTVGILGTVFLVVTRPRPLPDSHWAEAGAGDVENGRLVFSAGGCVSCHMAPGAVGDDQLVLAGGLALKSPFGTFYPPNISPDEQAGIGQWTLAEFGNALTRGVGIDGEHLYPSLPYGSYVRMSVNDVGDLYAYMRTLPKSTNVAPQHDLGFPFNIRLALGGWKLLYFNDKINNAYRVDIENYPDPDKVRRGQYLVEGPGHCGECHTPRDMLGGFVKDMWLAGAPNPEGKGTVPNITPGGKDIASWSAEDISYYLETGFKPDFDVAGGSMAEVVRNMGKLPASDRAAIAAYLKAIPAH